MPVLTAASSAASRRPESTAARFVRHARRCRRTSIFFPTAAAAQEAGFRPCLRCRPETAPDLGAWRGTSNTVSRALSLIEHGALDEADVDVLAGRLGVGERQLRRLFQQHLGASPVAVAQTRRVLLAKQLIHETHLPMTEVAFAAGFRSIRRFNETFRQLFGRSPRELRRTTWPEFSTAAAGELVLLLRYQPPYDWEATIGFLRQRAIAGIEYVGVQLYARTLQLDGLTGTVTVAAGGRQRVARHRAFPKTLGVAHHHRAAATRIRSRRRSAGYRRASCKGSDAGAARESAPGLARTRRLGRLRIGDPCRAWPADYRGRGCAACRPHGGGLWRAAVITRRTSDARFSTAGGHCRRRSRFARHAEKPGRRAVGGRSGGCCRSACVRRQLRARRRGEKATRHPWCW